MKCPQCLVRNSVAARQCKDCGTKFARKGVSKALILGGVGVVAVCGLAVAALSVVPAAFDPEANLQKVAKKVAAGPKSGADAEHIKAELESTTKDFLEKDSKLTTPELTAKLQKIFPNSAFETRVFDLPHNLRLVEIDTMLQATDYLLSGKHVAVLRNFEVFETAKVVPDGIGSDITLLGHRNAQAGHRPQVRVFALLPDGVADRTQESVPPISGDGSAVFATNDKDINLDLSLMSKASEERLFTIDTLSKGVLSDETVKSRLTLKNGKYELSEDQGKSPFAALRAAAFVLADPSAKERFKRFFADNTIGSIASLGKLKVNPPLFIVKKIGSTKSSAGSASVAGSSSSDDDSRHSRRHRGRHRHHEDDAAPADASTTGNTPGGPNASAAAAAIPAASYTFLLNNAQDAFEVAMARRDGRYLVTSVKRVKASNEGTDMVVEAKPAEEAAKIAGIAVGTAEAAKDSKVGSKMDDYGTQNNVTVDNTNLSNKVVIKQASKESAEQAAGVEAEKKPEVSANRNSAAPKDKTALALATPPVSPVAGNSAKNAAASQGEKNTVLESGVISTTDSPSIKLRRGASTTFKSIGELKRGESVQILSKQDDWYKVQVDGKIGYVFGAYVQTKSHPASSGTAAVSTSASTSSTKTVAPESLSRSGASKDKASQAASSETASSSSTVIKRTRNLRDEDHRKIGVAEAGNKVVVLGQAANGKYKVRLSNGVIGYVDREAFDGLPKFDGRAETKAVEKASVKTVEKAPEKTVEKAPAKSSSKSKESTRHKSHKSAEKAAESASDMPQMVP
jgi:hypothetical protein